MGSRVARRASYACKHKLCGLLPVFSTVAGNAASDLEDHAARGQLEQARPLVEQLESMVQKLVQQLAGLSLEALKHRVRKSDA